MKDISFIYQVSFFLIKPAASFIRWKFSLVLHYCYRPFHQDFINISLHFHWQFSLLFLALSLCDFHQYIQPFHTHIPALSLAIFIIISTTFIAHFSLIYIAISYPYPSTFIGDFHYYFYCFHCTFLINISSNFISISQHFLW